MAKGFRECRICGERYEYCSTDRNTNIFRWQDVACCPAHGAQYFERVARARAEQAQANRPAPEPAAGPEAAAEAVKDAFAGKRSDSTVGKKSRHRGSFGLSRPNAEEEMA